jgi:hypothetical protein
MLIFGEELLDGRPEESGRIRLADLAVERQEEKEDSPCRIAQAGSNSIIEGGGEVRQLPRCDQFARGHGQSASEDDRHTSFIPSAGCPMSRP